MTPELLRKLGERAFIPPEVYTHPDVKALCRLVQKDTAEDCARLATAAADAIKRKYEVAP